MTISTNSNDSRLISVGEPNNTMKKVSTQAETVLEVQSPNKLRRSKSREATSHLQKSPIHPKPNNKNRFEESPTSVSLQTLWPYSSPSSNPTFSDHLKPRLGRTANENRRPIFFAGENSTFRKKSDRRASDGLAEARKRGVEVASRYMAERAPRPPNGGNKSPVTFRRVRSMSFSGGWESPRTQRASSPGRSVSEEKLVNGELGYLRSKKSNSVSESVNDFRLLHNRLVQWRFVNARAELVNVKITKHAQCNLIGVWKGFEKLRHSVVEKRIQLQRERLEMKLNSLLRSQRNLLQIWDDMESQYSSILTMAIESLHSVAFRVPLVEGAKVETRSCCIAIGQALDLASSLETMLKSFSSKVEENVELLFKLAKVVSQEKLLLQECVELLRPMSFSEIEEWSLRCGITQIGCRPKQGTINQLITF